MPVESTSYAIIIPACNEAEALPVTLNAVRRAMAAQDLPGECIVVDNHSGDDTAAVAKAGGADRVVFEPVNQSPGPQCRGRCHRGGLSGLCRCRYPDRGGAADQGTASSSRRTLCRRRRRGLFRRRDHCRRPPGHRSLETDFPVYPYCGRQFLVLPPRRLPSGRRFRSQALCRRRSAAVTPVEKMGPRPRSEIYHHHRHGIHRSYDYERCCKYDSY